MNLRRLVKYALFRDTTMKGEFRMMQSLAGEKCPTVFVDVGANDGFYGSNSFPFVARGWRSLLIEPHPGAFEKLRQRHQGKPHVTCLNLACSDAPGELPLWFASNDPGGSRATLDRKSTRLNSSHRTISYAVFCLKKKKKNTI